MCGELPAGPEALQQRVCPQRTVLWRLQWQPAVCENGTCVARRNGEGCSVSSECASGICRDGFCCNSACTGQCESCASAANRGTCVAVTAPRTACDGSGICGGRCDGFNRASCVYPGSTTPAAFPPVRAPHSHVGLQRQRLLHHVVRELSSLAAGSQATRAPRAVRRTATTCCPTQVSTDHATAGTSPEESMRTARPMWKAATLRARFS